MVQSPETVRRFKEEILPGLDLADAAALARIQERWQLSVDPEGGEPFQRPTLILTGLQDESVGCFDQFALLPHYPLASFPVLDVAGHNLQIEQADPFNTLTLDWLARSSSSHDCGPPGQMTETDSRADTGSCGAERVPEECELRVPVRAPELSVLQYTSPSWPDAAAAAASPGCHIRVRR
ncbi:alpha/beta fold hydrolase [Streptomyces sp. NPDC008121]|uniref:alpha/beta fold hydrolase n=1 Tax=Streptomyces sp. NPDC008121 TaxID=3364809 RepID=UPI0036E87D21